MAGRNFLFVPGPTNVPDRILRAMHRAMEDHRSSDFPGLAAAAVPGPEEDLQDHHRPAVHLPGERHRRLGGGARQHPLAGRQGARRPLRACSAISGSTWPSGSVSRSRCSTPSGARARRSSATATRSRPTRAARDQGRAVHAQRDRHRRHQRRRRRAPGAERRQAPRAALRGRRELDREHRFPDGRVGRGPRRHRLAEGAHAAGRARHRLRQPEGAGRSTSRPSCRAASSTSATCGRRTRPATSPTRRRSPCSTGCASRSPCCFEEGLENVFARHHRLAEGTRAAVKAWGLELCARRPKWHSDTVSAIMVPAGVERRRGHRRRLPPLQPRARRRPRADGRQALPHRPPGRSERAHAAGRRSPAPRWRCATSG